MEFIVTGRILNRNKLVGYRVWSIENKRLYCTNMSISGILKIPSILNCSINKSTGRLISNISIPIKMYPTYYINSRQKGNKTYTDSYIIAKTLNKSLDDTRIIVCGALVGGAISNPYSDKANAHAELYYEEIRHRKDDILKISKNTGYSPEQILRIKNYLFMEMHDLSSGYKRFDASFHIAQSWQRLCHKDGTLIKQHDLTLLAHELMEIELMDSGLTQDEAHMYAEGSFNYGKESDNYYDQIRRDSETR